MSSLQSPFFLKFSLRELIQRNDSTAGLDCSEKGGGGGATFGTGGVGQQETRFNKMDSLACQITDAELFDEAKFLQALKAVVEQDLIDRKATVVNRKKADATGFSLDYALSDVRGTVAISTTKGPARFYTLTANLSEKSK